MACALLQKRVTLSELVDDVVRRPDMQAMMKRVRVEPLTEYDPAMPQYSPYDQVRVRLKSGGVVESPRIERARGHITRPLTEAELFAKLASCLEFARSPLDARALFDAFNRLEARPAGWLAGLGAQARGAKASAAAAAHQE
jgi:2-methylcitrate dehydratase PrpD